MGSRPTRRIDRVIATVNEDADSSLYLVDPLRRLQTHYPGTASRCPTTAAPTRSRSITGMVLISASAPGTTGAEGAPQPSFPAVYRAMFDPQTRIADVWAAVRRRADLATVANTDAADFGQTVNSRRATDPDSSEDVPFLRAALRRRLHAHQPG